MDSRDLDEAACLADFFQLYLADAERGAVREPQEYGARFPEHEAAVLREYAALRGGGSVRDSEGPLTPELPGYRTLRELGRGGQGTVYLAEDLSLHRLVALKVVRTTLGRPSPTQRARLEREVDILARLDHPGICTVYRAHLDDDPPFVAMRYVSGTTLAELIARPDAPGPLACPPTGRAELERVLGFFEEAAKALHAAHEAGIVHRDVKPGNVVCDDGGRPVLLDFGLARREEDDGFGVTRTGEQFGTPAYMSPEQLLQVPDTLDRRTDVYSLGVTLFECLTRRRPFDEPSQHQLERAICEAPTPRASRLNRVLPTELDLVLDTALEKDVRRRYATARDLAEELRRVRERRPVLARPTSPILRARRWTERNPAAATAVVLLLLGAAGLAVALGYTEEARRLAESRSLAAAALAMMERDPVKAFDMALDSHDLAPGVDSRGALYRALADQQVKTVIELSSTSGNAMVVSPDRSVVAWVDFYQSSLFVARLPEGRHQFDVARPRRFMAIDVTNGGALVAAGFDDGCVEVYFGLHDPPALELRGGVEVVRSVAFSPDGSRLATGADDNLVRLWEIPTGRLLATLWGSLGPPCGLVFSPDGRSLASWVHELPGLPDRPDPTIRIWNVPEKRLAASLEGHVARVRRARFSRDGRLLASAGDDGTSRVWELPQGRLRHVFEHPGAVNDVGFSPDGSELATAFDPGQPGFSGSSGARVFSVVDGASRLELRGHESRPVSTVEWSPAGDCILTGSYDGTARIWDAANGRQLACIRSTLGFVVFTCWLDGSEQVLVQYPRQVAIARVRGDAGLPRLTGHEAPIVSAAFRSDGLRVATADAEGVTLVHDTRTGALVTRLRDGPAASLRVAYCGDEFLLIASDDGGCRLFDANTGDFLWCTPVGSDPVRLLRVLPGGRGFLASSGALVVLFAFDREGGDRLREFRGHQGELRCLDLSPDGTTLATGAADRTVRVWEVSTGVCRAVLNDWWAEAYETERDVYDVLFHSDGSGLLTAHEDGCLRDYQMPGGELVCATQTGPRYARALWLEEGRRALLMMKWSPWISQLQMNSFELTQIEPTAVGRLLAMDVSRDGALVLVGSTDGTTMLWRTDDFSRAWASVRGHAGPVLFAAFSPDGSQFLTASADGTARLWPTDPVARARETRPRFVPLDGR